MAAAILSKFDDVVVTLSKGEGGIFDVLKNDELVYSKKKLGLLTLKEVIEEDVIKTLE